MVQSYTLPDGRVIKVGAERFMASEIMFRPELINIEVPGVSESIFNCIQVRILPKHCTQNCSCTVQLPDQPLTKKHPPAAF